MHNPAALSPKLEALEKATRYLNQLYQEYQAGPRQPREGDWIKHPDGTLERIGILWYTDKNGCKLQVSKDILISFYFSGVFGCKVSGSLDRDSSRTYFLHDSGTLHPARVFFRDGRTEKDNVLNAEVPLKVWEIR